MRKLIVVFLLLFVLHESNAQTKYYLRFDSVYVFSGTNGELILQNGTRAKAGAFLKNNGNGRTEFAYTVDSAWITGDSLYLKRGDSLIAFAGGKKVVPANGLTQIDDTTIALGGQLEWPTNINGNLNELQIQNLSQFGFGTENFEQFIGTYIVGRGQRGLKMEDANSDYSQYSRLSMESPLMFNLDIQNSLASKSMNVAANDESFSISTYDPENGNVVFTVGGGLGFNISQGNIYFNLPNATSGNYNVLVQDVDAPGIESGHIATIPFNSIASQTALQDTASAIRSFINYLHTPHGDTLKVTSNVEAGGDGTSPINPDELNFHVRPGKSYHVQGKIYVNMGFYYGYSNASYSLQFPNADVTFKLKDSLSLADSTTASISNGTELSITNPAYWGLHVVVMDIEITNVKNEGDVVFNFAFGCCPNNGSGGINAGSYFVVTPTADENFIPASINIYNSDGTIQGEYRHIDLGGAQLTFDTKQVTPSDWGSPNDSLSVSLSIADKASDDLTIKMNATYYQEGATPQEHRFLFASWASQETIREAGASWDIQNSSVEGSEYRWDTTGGNRYFSSRYQSYSANQIANDMNDTIHVEFFTNAGSYFPDEAIAQIWVTNNQWDASTGNKVTFRKDSSIFSKPAIFNGGIETRFFRMSSSETPTNPVEDVPAGTVQYDDDYLYIRTFASWKKIPLTAL